MHKIKLIIQREYLTRIRKRSFWILTFLFPLISLLFIGFPLLMDKISNGVESVAVVDQSGLFNGQLKNSERLKFRYFSDHLDSLKHNFKQLGFDGVLFIPAGFIKDSGLNTQYYSDEQLPFISKSVISNQLTEVVHKIKLQQAHLTDKEIDQLNTDVSISTTTINESGEHQTNSAIATGLAYVTGILLYILLILYGTMVMRGVAEEKVNRIAEVIISSVKPFQLMIGKIVGIGLVGLTQFFTWIVLIYVIDVVGMQYFGIKVSQENPVANSMNMQTMSPPSAPFQQSNNWTTLVGSAIGDFNQLPLGLIAFCFVFYFLAGYLLYAALFAAIGSAMGDEPGDQSMSFVVTLPIILSFFIMITVLDQPNSSLAVFASIFPLSAPIVMLARVPFGVPVWQIIASMLSVIIGFLCTTWLAAKIYRVGILLYGKKSSFKEIAKWVRY